MLKRLVCVIIVMVFAGGNAQAAPTYGTDMPKKRQISEGYQTNIMFKHDLADTYGNVKSVQHYFDISYGVADWFALDGKIGLGDTLRKGGIHPKIDYRYGFAGGYGFRILVFEEAKNSVKGVLGFHHICVHPSSRNLNGDKHQGILDDWQCSFVTSKDIGRLTPFLGIKGSTNDYICKVNEIDRKRRPPEYYVGLIVGCSARLCGGISVRVEGRFIDESAMTAGAYYTF